MWRCLQGPHGGAGRKADCQKDEEEKGEEVGGEKGSPEKEPSQKNGCDEPA